MYIFLAGFCLSGAQASLQTRSQLGPTIRNEPSAVKSRHSVGPTIQNEPRAVLARHSLGPTIRNEPGAIRARHSVGAQHENSSGIGNLPQVGLEKEKSKSSGSDNVAATPASDVDVLDLNVE